MSSFNFTLSPAQLQPINGIDYSSARQQWSRLCGLLEGKGDQLGGKGASSHLEGVSSQATVAVIEPSGRVIMSGGTTGSGILERGLAHMPVIVFTWEGGPPTDIDPKRCKLCGCPSPG